jgi:hypothetical protein
MAGYCGVAPMAYLESRHFRAFVLAFLGDEARHFEFAPVPASAIPAASGDTIEDVSQIVLSMRLVQDNIGAAIQRAWVFALRSGGANHILDFRRLLNGGPVDVEEHPS